MSHVLIIFYSQAGQTERAIESFVRGLGHSVNCEVMRIQTTEKFPFPWKMRHFFRAFPRSVLGPVPEVEPLRIQWDKYDLIVLGYQVWFLNPSLPMQGFLNSPEAQGLRGADVISLATCRNLYQSAFARFRGRLVELGADHWGQLTVCELSPVWASFVTTPRWMLTGRKGAFAFFPPAGIEDAEFVKLEAKGQRVGQAIALGSRAAAQAELTPNTTEPSLAVMDGIGAKFFKIWASLILKVAPNVGLWQDLLLILFRINLIALIVVVGVGTKLRFMRSRA